MSAKIAIVGAGPAGAAAAITLAQRDISFTIFDKATFPRDKICGDALSGKAVEALKKINPQLHQALETYPAKVPSWGVTFVAPNQKALRVPFKRNFSKNEPAPGYISKRFDFDNFLFEKVKSHSAATVVEGVEVKSFERKGDKVILSDGTSQLGEFDVVIAADGAHSAFAKEFWQVEKSHYCAGVRAYYSGVEALDEDNFIELHFLKEALPGYLWIFPLPNGQANVGLGMRSDVISKKKINLKKLLFEIVQNHPQISQRFQQANLEDTVKGFGLPLGSKKRRLAGDSVLLTGDAGSLIDPFTGEGIGNALFSGIYAAETVAEQLPQNNFSGSSLKKYEERVYHRMWDELRLSRSMQQLVQYPWLFNLVVNKAISNPTLSEMISCMFEDLDMRDRLRKPGFYFKLLFNR